MCEKTKFLNILICSTCNYHRVLNLLVSHSGEYKYCIILGYDVVFCSELDTSSWEKYSYKITRNYISENEEF